MSHHHHHPKHVFDASKAERLLDPKRRMIDDPLALVQEMGVQPGMRVADLGCGAGFFTGALLEAVGDQGAVIGVELQKPVVDFFRKRMPDVDNLSITQADVVDTGLDDHSVDLAFIAFTLHEVQVMDALAEVKRIVKPGGLMAAMDWGAYEPCPERKPGNKAGPPEDHRLLIEGLRRHLEESDMVEQASGERMGGCQYWLTARIG